MTERPASNRPKAAAPAPPTAAIDAILEQIKSLEPLPQVALQVLALSDKPDVTPNELIAVIEVDAAVTAKVLKLTNSAFYGFARQIASVKDAGNLLGARQLFNLVLTSCAGRYFRDYGGTDPKAMQRLWESSVLQALAASTLARMHGGVDRHRAYTAGLLQNIGRIVLERFVVPHRAQVDGELALGADRVDVERRLFSIDHAEVGARLAERWSFPEALCDTIRHHHAPECATVDPLLASFCHLAETITSALDLDGGIESAGLNLTDGALVRAGLDADSLASLEGQLLAELRKARALIEVG